MNKHPQKATLYRQSLSWDGSASYTNIGTFNTRWEDEQRLGQTDGSRLVFSRSVVYFPEDTFQIGDMIIEGEFEGDTLPPTSFEIKDKMRTPNLSGTKYEYKAIV